MSKQNYAVKCEGCKYYRNLSATEGVHGGRACHYFLDTGHLKKMENGVCKSKDIGVKKRGTRRKP